MIKFFTICIITLFSTYLNGQIIFERTYGGHGEDRGEAIIQCSDTGYLIVGSTSSFGNDAQFYVLKIDSMGDFKWSKTIGGSNQEQAYDVVEIPEGGYAVCGITNSYGKGGYDGYLARLNASGDTLWTKTYGGTDWDLLNAIVLMPDSGFVMAGKTYSFGNGNSDAYLIRTDKNGDTLWTKTYGSSDEEEFRDIIIDKNNLYIAGNVDSISGNKNGLLFKLDFNSNVLWQKSMGGDSSDYFEAISIDHKSTLLIAGKSNSYQMLGDFDSWAMFIDTNGNLIHNRPTFDYGGAHVDEFFNDVIQLRDDSIIFLGGRTYSTSDKMNLYLKEFEPNTYNVVNEFQKFSDGFYDFYSSIDTTNDGGYVMLGTLENTSFGNSSIYVAKHGPTGYFHFAYDNYPPHTLDNTGISSIDQIERFNDNFNVYPNPFDDKINVSTSIIVDKLNIKIFDLSGRVIFENRDLSLNEFSDISFRHLKKGMYIIHFSATDNTITKRLIKQ